MARRSKIQLELAFGEGTTGEAQGDRISEQGQKPGEVGFVPTGSLELSAE